jgi:hypothetical protein
VFAYIGFDYSKFNSAAGRTGEDQFLSTGAENDNLVNCIGFIQLIRTMPPLQSLGSIAFEQTYLGADLGARRASSLGKRLHLARSLHLVQPARAILDPQLAAGLHLLQCILLVERPGKYNRQPLKRVRVGLFA